MNKGVFMLKNYFKIALRNLFRHKVYSFINILGLVIGMVCVVLIMLWVQDEVSYDNFHEKSNRICKVYVKFNMEGKTINSERTFSAVANDLKDRYPEIKSGARIFEVKDCILKAIGSDDQNGNTVFAEKKGMAADPSFLQIFSFPLLKGNPRIALENQNSIVITEEMAKKYFGDQDAVGKTMTINNRYDVTVTGILKNIPFNSHIRFDFLVPLKLLENFGYNLNDYNTTSFITYLLLNNAASVQELNNKIQQEFDKTIPVKEIKFQHSIETLPRVHLFGDELFPRIIFVYALAGLAILILFIACINFINLSTARSMVRSKEIGVRKVIGAQRLQLITQFLCDSIFISFVAMVIALIIVQFLLPLFNQITEKHITFQLFNMQFILGLLCIVGSIGILAGSYPALYLSGLDPMNILRGSASALKIRRRGSNKALLRKILVVTQFTFTIILIVNILNGFRWNKHMSQLGFDKDNVICIRTNGGINNNYPAFKNELLKNQEIEIVSTSSQLPLAMTISGSTNWGLKNEAGKILAMNADVGYDYARMFKLKMVQGRYFSEEFPSDENSGIIINEKAAKLIGVKDPVGKRFYFQGREYTIIGVMQDFHSLPKILEIPPNVFLLRPQNFEYIFVRLKADVNNRPVENVALTIEDIKKTYKKFNVDNPFEYFFLNEFKFEEGKIFDTVEKILISFTLLGIFIAALGLFGLSSFMIELRTKEIGIRKSLGASFTKILALLSKDYLKLIIIANAIAWPLSFMIENSMSNLYFYKIDFAYWLFIAAGSFVLLIALAAVGMQSVRAARTNPVKALRYE